MFWNKRKKVTRQKSDIPIVQVQFLDFDEPIRSKARVYSYLWPLDKEPKVGDRVVVPDGANEDAPALVVGLGRGDYSGALKQVTRLATAGEIARGY